MKESTMWCSRADNGDDDNGDDEKKVAGVPPSVMTLKKMMMMNVNHRWMLEMIASGGE